MTHHSIMTYQERLATYIETLARQNADLVRGWGQEQLSANMTSLFATPFSPHTSPEKTAQQAALDSLGKAAGTAAQVTPLLLFSSCLLLFLCLQILSEAGAIFRSRYYQASPLTSLNKFSCRSLKLMSNSDLYSEKF